MAVAAGCVGQRITEVLQSFPALILAMAISMAIGTGMPAVIVAIAITRIPFGNRVIRSVALTIRELAYVEAARAAGGSAFRVMTLHVLPQCVAPYLVLATAHLAVAGVPPDDGGGATRLRRAETRSLRLEWRGAAPGPTRAQVLPARDLVVLGEGNRPFPEPGGLDAEGLLLFFDPAVAVAFPEAP